MPSARPQPGSRGCEYSPSCRAEPKMSKRGCPHPAKQALAMAELRVKRKRPKGEHPRKKEAGHQTTFSGNRLCFSLWLCRSLNFAALMTRLFQPNGLFDQVSGKKKRPGPGDHHEQQIVSLWARWQIRTQEALRVWNGRDKLKVTSFMNRKRSSFEFAWKSRLRLISQNGSPARLLMVSVVCSMRILRNSPSFQRSIDHRQYVIQLHAWRS